MDISLVRSKTVELLSQITGLKLIPKNLTPLVIFLANLVTVLLAVIIDKFLTSDSRKLKIKCFVTQINRMVQKSLDGLYQFEDILKGKIQISEVEKQKILEKIGEASGRDVRIRLLADQLIHLVFEQIAKSWHEWRKGLSDRIAQKSQYWNSEHNPVLSQDKLIRDYTYQFIRDLSIEIDEWGNKKLKEVILQENLKYLDTNIVYELDAIQGEFNSLDQNIRTNFSEQLKLSIDGINDDFMGMGGIGGGIGIGGALAAGLIVFTGLGFIAVIVASLAATIAGSFGFGMLDFDGLKDQIKGKVFEVGFQKFDESTDKLSEKLDEIVGSVFNSRVESASRVIAQAIALYENLLEQQEKAHNETLEQREAEKIWIYQKRQELEKVQNGLEIILSKCTIV
ncbi:MAG: hypothetical protein V7K90_22205 [Nostoc sp.]|uniref:hypothetical protein n=1 Tax=Nostoc sp. TaxID=1180 RepID=UPI002FFB462F